MGSPLTIGIIFLVVMLILLFLGVSVGTSMAVAAILGIAFILTPTAALAKVGSTPYETMNSYSFAVIPLFVLMANIIATTGVGKALYEFFNSFVGHIRGGLAMATILACAIFSAISSTPIGTVITIGLIALPEMKRKGYSDSLATGAIASGGSLGPLIPPSAVLIIYAIVTQTSMTRLFIAGVIPGIILALLMCLAIYVYCLIVPTAGPRSQRHTFKEAAQALSRCFEIILLIALVLLGLFFGWFTPTEAGAIGSVGAIVVTLVRRKLTMERFLAAVKDTLENTGMVYLVLIGAFLLNYLAALAGISSAISNFVSSLDMGYKMVTIIIFCIYIFLGCFLDALAMILLTMPIFFPVITDLGGDPIWFGIIVVLAMNVGNITPPVGMSVFVVAGLDRSIRMETIFKGVFPFVIANLILVVVLVLFPEIVMWLPSLIKG